MKTLQWILSIVFILLLGCGKEAQKEIEKQKKENPTREIQVEKKTEPVSNVVPAKPETAPVSVERIPEKREPEGDPMAQKDEKDWEDKDWYEMRNIYVAQYLDQMGYVMAGLKNPIPKTTATFLEKGYALYWDPTTVRPKELELGFFYARVQKEADLQENFQKMEKSGKGEHYYKLAYIVAWYYCLQGQNAKAKTLLAETDLFTNLAAYGIDVPTEHIALLKAKAEEQK